MGLDIFQTQRDIKPEKTLEIVSNADSALDELVFNLVEYLEQNINPNGWKEQFNYYKRHFQKNYKITPSLISKVNLVPPKNKSVYEHYPWSRGMFLSALIQVSYEQGFNSFEFKEVHNDRLGIFLVGKKGKPIKIKVEKLNGEWAFGEAKNVIAEVQKYKGYCFGRDMKDCKIYSSNQQTLQRLKAQGYRQQGVQFILGKMPLEEKT